MIINGRSLLFQAPIKNMLTEKHTAHGVTHGLTECGYDLQIKQTVIFFPPSLDPPHPDDKYALTGTAAIKWREPDGKQYGNYNPGRFILASAMEEFQMPNNLMGIVHDKSTWARRGLSVFNTVIEPGWNGFLTLELVYHGHQPLTIPAGSGIAQVIFHDLTELAAYQGKYQDQADKPVPAILA